MATAHPNLTPTVILEDSQDLSHLHSGTTLPGIYGRSDWPKYCFMIAMPGWPFGKQPTVRNAIPGLDGIRGLAVLTVFVFHAELLPHVPGELATTVFFFLSGFLITTLFIREWGKTGDLDLKSFYWRRVLRIFPPLYTALAVALLLRGFAHVGTPLIPWKTAGNFFQYTNYAVALTSDGAGFLPGMILLWSLAVDEHYYLFGAPLLRWGLKKFDTATLAAGVFVLCILGLAWRTYIVHRMGYADYRVSMATDTRIDSILWGVFLALWRNPAQNAERAKWLAKPWMVATGLVLVLLPSLTGNDNIKCTLGYTIEGIGLIPLFAIAILQGGKGWLKFLHWPWLLWMSKISYSFYLVSWLTLSTVRRFFHGPRLEQVMLSFVIAFLVASAMHLAIERPLMAMRKKKKASSAPVVPELATAAAS